MLRKRAVALAEALHEYAGEYLRAVGYYDDEHTELVYVRSDLDRERLDGAADRVGDRFRQESRAREQQVFPFGDLHGTVRSFDEGVVLHFPFPRERGVMVTLDPEAARQLNDFMAKCNGHLSDG